MLDISKEIYGRKHFPWAVGTIRYAKKKEHEQFEKACLIYVEQQKCWNNARHRRGTCCMILATAEEVWDANQDF